MDETPARLAALPEAQAAEVLRVLFAQVDPQEPVTDEDDIADRADVDREYLLRLVEVVGSGPAEESGEGTARSVLLALYDNIDDLRPVISNALDAAALSRDTLDFGVTALAAFVIIGVCAAIMRPRVKIEETSKVTENHDGSKTTEKRKVFEAEIRGVRNPQDLLRAILPFLKN